MSSSSPRTISKPRAVAVAMCGVLVAALAAVTGPALASSHSGHGLTMAKPSSKGDMVGNTRGWLNGRTVNFHYTKDFFCRQPPHSKAGSHCELGANYQVIPAKEFDPLYVVVPIGFTPPSTTLQCPRAGRCIDHPHRMDLTRVFGSGTGNALLPPHSHVVTTAAGHDQEWWNVDVVGVTNRAAWHRIVTHKSYGTIQRMRNHGNPNVTENLTTNLFLFFGVRPAA
jgi:hypothetical protein